MKKTKVKAVKVKTTKIKSDLPVKTKQSSVEKSGFDKLREKLGVKKKKKPVANVFEDDFDDGGGLDQMYPEDRMMYTYHKNPGIIFS